MSIGAAFLNPADPWAALAFQRFMDRLHDLCEWEQELSYHAGYAAGYAAANAQVEAVLRFALGGPGARTWRSAVGRHHRALEARQHRRHADRSGARPGDHLGGPVDFDTGRPVHPRGARHTRT